MLVLKRKESNLAMERRGALGSVPVGQPLILGKGCMLQEKESGSSAVQREKKSRKYQHGKPCCEIAISSSRGSSQARGSTRISCVSPALAECLLYLCKVEMLATGL